jgi:branched-chain amino acid aminotransferase
MAWHFFDGTWHDGNPGIMGPMSHGSWMASTVFDGARVIDGRAPDLARHCARLMESARVMDLTPPIGAEDIVELVRDGVRRMRPSEALYVKPMFWAETGFVAPDPDSARFCLTLAEAPLPPADGIAVTLSRFRRPTPESAPTDAKAACLYPNNGRALREARRTGFDNAVLLDAMGNVAELATANIWLVRDGEVATPVPNGCFLDGITKQRVAHLLAEDGHAVRERRVTWAELEAADEIFATGNYGKVLPVTRIGGRELAPGPVARRARELYWAWMADTPTLA